MAKYWLEYKGGALVVQDSFASISKAREIARYFVTSSKKEIRISQTIPGGSGIKTVGYVGLLKDYKTYYFEDSLGYKFNLKRNGTLGTEIPYTRRK